MLSTPTHGFYLTFGELARYLDVDDSTWGPARRRASVELTRSTFDSSASKGDRFTASPGSVCCGVSILYDLGPQFVRAFTLEP